MTGTALWSLLCTQLTGSIDLFKDEDDDDDAGSRIFFFFYLIIQGVCNLMGITLCARQSMMEPS